MTDVKNLAEFHAAVRAAVESLREETGAFVSMIAVNWDNGKIESINTQMGTLTVYEETKDDNGEA